MGKLRSRVGLGLLVAAVFDDVLVILLLSTVVALFSGTGAGLVQILIIIGRMVLITTPLTPPYCAHPFAGRRRRQERLRKRSQSLNRRLSNVLLRLARAP